MCAGGRLRRNIQKYPEYLILGKGWGRFLKRKFIPIDFEISDNQRGEFNLIGTVLLLRNLNRQLIPIDFFNLSLSRGEGGV